MMRALLNQAFGGRSSGKAITDGVKGNFVESAVTIFTKGEKTHAHSFMQGISPFDDRAGVDEWQRSSVPMAA